MENELYHVWLLTFGISSTNFKTEKLASGEKVISPADILALSERQFGARYPLMNSLYCGYMALEDVDTVTLVESK